MAGMESVDAVLVIDILLRYALPQIATLDDLL